MSFHTFIARKYTIRFLSISPNRLEVASVNLLFKQMMMTIIFARHTVGRDENGPQSDGVVIRYLWEHM